MARDAIKSTDGGRFGASGGRIFPGPPTSITQYAVPVTATDPCNRVYMQDQSMQTSDLELAHAQRYQRASGEAWAHYGWDAERVKNLLHNRNYGLSIDEVNLAHQALSSLAAYEGLKSGEAELYREVHPNMLEWGSFSSVSQIGLGRFKKAWGRMKAWLQRQYPEVSANVAGLSSTPDTATPPPGISHFWARALDIVGGSSTTTTAATLQRVARTKAEAAIERNRERERSRSRPKVLPPKHIPVRQSMVAINLDAPIPVPGPTPESKADPQLPPQNFVMVVHPMWRPPLGLAGSTDVAALLEQM